MKNFVAGIVLFSFAILFSSLTGTSEIKEETSVNWLSWEEAVELSKKEKKKIFVDVYTDWCGWCKKMDKGTFGDPDVAAFLNDHYYPVKLNAEQKEDIIFQDYTFKYVATKNGRGYHQLAGALLDGNLRYPTVLFLDENFQIIQRFATYLDAPTFDMIQRYLADDSVRQSVTWEDFQKQYKANN